MALKNFKDSFFTGQRIRVVKRFIQTSKLLRSLVNLIWSVTCLFLNIEKEFSGDNLLGLTDKPGLASAEKEYVVIQTRTPIAQTTIETSDSVAKTKPRELSGSISQKNFGRTNFKSPF